MWDVEADESDRSLDIRRLGAALGPVEGADAISGSQRRSARHPAYAALLCLSVAATALSPAARLGKVPLAGRGSIRVMALQPQRRWETARTGAPPSPAGPRLAR